MWNRITHCHCISHLIASLRHILHCIIPHQTQSLALFQTTPQSTSHHRSSTCRTFHNTSPRSTLFHFAIPYFKSPHVSATLCISPHLALHPISQYVPNNATFHVLHATFQITPYIGHIMCIAPHLASHRVLHNIALHSTTSDRDHTRFHIPLPCFT